MIENLSLGPDRLLLLLSGLGLYVTLFFLYIQYRRDVRSKIKADQREDAFFKEIKALVFELKLEIVEERRQKE